MIIGFGFGNPLTALVMLLATSAISYGLYRWFSGRRVREESPERRREALRRYYREQRELARRMASEFDISDEEIERRIEEELRRDDR
ncbi:hypothetical protein GCM10025857_09910 [Alicyclobacillus contaminans]|uniref:hypothetical protein n=1 Tax=Alicyclobacillus contaminans TaxID=392016 RepID=UPI000421D94C|nr:hypothetical protein [Alicyclobacillus contaminans]GMA49634.1 hypothetical protein GCM10025857_09910 [Alicyclobacillus contaminans]